MQDQPSTVPARYLRETDFRSYVPVHVVWEITLACDQKCLHCGSRAGHRRQDELSTDECLEVIRTLAGMGTREVTLIGGEAYMRKDWTTLIRAITDHGMICSIQSGGRTLTRERLQAAIDAGLRGIGVSLDGLAPLHDRLRNVPGSFELGSAALVRAKEAGLKISVNTQIGAETLADLPALMEHVLALGASHWQIQLTVAMGNAVDNPELLLQPWQLAEVMPVLADLYRKGLDQGLLMTVGNNIGYFGPYEALWRGFGDERIHWAGCGAGRTVMALEADGTVKGCPSLATQGFSGGSVRDHSLPELWQTSPEIHFGRLRSVADLWGFCRTCYYNDTCRAGCTWTAHSLFGKPGNNPYCHHRVLTLQQQGLRERIVKVKDAPPESFAIGQFDLLLERIDDGTVIHSVITSDEDLSLHLPGPHSAADGPGQTPQQLSLCRHCSHYIHPDEVACPFCGGDVASGEARHRQQQAHRQQVISALQAAMRQAGYQGDFS
ncbi:GDL motif peptide-associated radical SAM/SPASM maturase [Insolitispirillum peregrinum]|uniref:Y_X(10)_GDL-associated radical SAM protein n=1 Tax=Insolitispirillum peregrinum TaxID=80876 RepID=A0A1N7MBK1_9PROT|nr:GDL motif peptide-associated radical SAM/SPASM maturase [Insolitispirillum peregrinum]SIS83361.1 Y_X(10)_GDL-associated radical SAM protein [Insolitispirillum peregrinum]